MSAFEHLIDAKIFSCLVLWALPFVSFPHGNRHPVKTTPFIAIHHNNNNQQQHQLIMY
eukprot:m.274550 g.274550  ORF g.274550 m.274550 type:complete len:58 (+) comp70262_c0_seq1:69-242(+)